MSLLILVSIVFGVGITIYPGASLSFVRAIGTEIRLPSLYVVNVNDKPMDYELRVLSTELLDGYFPLPDVEWVRLGQKEYRIQPYDTVEVPVFITIPQDSINYNRAWSFDVTVTQKPIDPKAAGFAMVQLGAKATWFVETKAVENYLPEPNGEPLAVSPGVWFVDFEGEEETAGEIPIEIRNDDDVEHTYYFEVYNEPDFGDSIRGQKLDIMPMFAFSENWITNWEWLHPKPGKFLFFKKKPKITLGPGEVGKHFVELDFPEGVLGENVYETVVLIKPDGIGKDGRFVRFVVK